MPSADLPKHAQVLVIGGGPGGSYTASVLAREGFDVVLFEAAHFPRYHIGESLLPSVRHFLRFIDAEEKIASYGFVRKPGSAIKFNQYMQEGYTDFVALGASNNAWNVTRSEFDHLLLKHAASCGAKVYEQTRVTDITFDNTPPPSPVRATFPQAPSRPSLGHRRSSTVEFAVPGAQDAASLGRPRSVIYETAYGSKREITFDYLVDASGRAGIMSTKYLKNRKFNTSLKNVAVWGYWKNTGMYGAGTSRENAPFFEALSDESGWAWFIPLQKGLTSVGIVMDQKQLGIRSRASSSAGSPHLNGGRRGSISARTASTLADRYLSFLQLAPGVSSLVGDGELVSIKTDEEDDSQQEAPVARSASDYSYSASEYAGAGFRIVGDAGSFIDPFFSSGVHLAMTGALSAASSVAASIRGDCTEVEAANWHSSRVSLSYTRFLIVVLSAYKQIRAQSSNVLADIEEKTFDKAFAFLRPGTSSLIQGGADMGARLSEDEVQRALDFCVHLFDPTTPEQHETVRRKLEIVTGMHIPIPPSPDSPSSTKTAFEPDVARLFDVRAPVIDPAQLERLLRLQLKVQDTHSVPSPPPSPRSPITPTGLRIPPPIREAGADPHSEIRMVLDKVNARRVIHAEHGNGLNSLEEEVLGGYALRLRRGALGLQKRDSGECRHECDAL
ncbi:FAD/NAD(P)-binding domain-containing protein [Cerioporus squamosus]|nr:FAD/NAD(P)-binding domain-containing protein [Cerioporus squamosus]